MGEHTIWRSEMNFDTIKLSEPQPGIRQLSLYRPEKRNAISIQMRQEIIDCLKALEGDEKVVALIITGDGPSFSAGFDLGEFAQAEKAKDLALSSKEYHRAVYNFPKPVIGAINGFAFGGGFDLATLCDFRLCSSTAVFGHPEVKFGGHPIITPLRWIVGEGLARDLCFTGRHIKADEAHRIGLVSEVHEPDALMPRVMEFATMLLEGPPLTLAETKAYMNETVALDFEGAFLKEHDYFFDRKFLGK